MEKGPSDGQRSLPHLVWCAVKTHQNLHFKAEIFSFLSKYFVYRKLKRALQKLSFCFNRPDTGTGRILGNILYSLEEEKGMNTQ